MCSPAGPIAWQCNICGTSQISRFSELGRDVFSCCTCRSTTRMRHLMYVLSMTLFGRPLIMSEMPKRDSVRGLGLSDSQQISDRLATTFLYRNTFYHREPRLDIMELPAHMDEVCDFVISSDVFEHVPPPIEKAFINSRRLLRSGGTFFLTVPYTLQGSTLEHFPELFDYSIQKDEQGKFLENRTRDGQEQVFRNLEFHGGEGATLEMRLFSLGDIRTQLIKAGFKDITLWEDAFVPHGVYQPEIWGKPITAVAC